jgi:hypothetical protein
MSINLCKEEFGLSEVDLSGRLLEYGSCAFAKNEKSLNALHPITYCPPSENVRLPFDDFTFDLALCSYYLFTPVIADADRHLNVIRELARVAKEVRIFPLIDSQGVLSPLLGPVLLGLQQENYGVEVRDVTSSNDLKKNAMLRVWAQLCHM